MSKRVQQWQTFDIHYLLHIIQLCICVCTQHVRQNKLTFKKCFGIFYDHSHLNVYTLHNSNFRYKFIEAYIVSKIYGNDRVDILILFYMPYFLCINYDLVETGQIIELRRFYILPQFYLLKYIISSTNTVVTF